MRGIMGARNGRFRLSLLFAAAIMIAAALPSCSAAASSPPPRKPASPPVDAARRGPSSVVFPIHGNVYPHGLYYVSMTVGDPPKPYFLDIDTGSDLTWLQCDAPCISCSKGPHPLYKPAKNGLVPCKDPLCVSLQRSLLQDHQEGCDSPQQCDYEIQYADDGSSVGVLVNDVFTLRLSNSSVVHPRLSFGCGYDQQGSGANAPAPTDGVLGLGRGESSILSQLRELGVTRNVVGHCLSRRGGGYLFFGDDIVPSHGVTWVPMSQGALRDYYSPGLAHLFLGKQSLGVKELQVVFDSGSSYTYFANAPYQALLSAVKRDLSKKPLKEAFEDPALPLCWKGPEPFKSVFDVKKYFNPLALGFVNGKKASYLEIPPENYLIITNLGNACLGILNGTEVGLQDLNVIGDVSLQDVMVVYDNEQQQIGWFRTSCDRIPKSGTTPLAEDSDGFEGVSAGHCLRVRAPSMVSALHIIGRIKTG